MADFNAELPHFMAGLRQKEQSGRYDWKPNAAGAEGAYQFTNYEGWAREAGVDPRDISPAAQDRVAAFKIRQYYQQFGNWTAVAQAWLGGPGSVGKNVTDPYTGITSNQYAADVLRLAGFSASGQPMPVTSKSAAPSSAPTTSPSASTSASPATDPTTGEPDLHNPDTQMAAFAAFVDKPFDFSLTPTSPKGATDGGT